MCSGMRAAVPTGVSAKARLGEDGYCLGTEPACPCTARAGDFGLVDATRKIPAQSPGGDRFPKENFPSHFGSHRNRWNQGATFTPPACGLAPANNGSLRGGVPWRPSTGDPRLQGRSDFLAPPNNISTRPAQLINLGEPETDALIAVSRGVTINKERNSNKRHRNSNKISNSNVAGNGRNISSLSHSQTWQWLS